MGNTGRWRKGRLFLTMVYVVELMRRVRNQTIWETFIVSQLKEDAILEMPFLKRHKCHIDFSKSAVVMAEHELTCVDKSGRPPSGRRAGSTELYDTWPLLHHYSLQVNSRRISGLGVVEGDHDRIQLASSLNLLSA